jgi:hypothetical protein
MRASSEAVRIESSGMCASCRECAVVGGFGKEWAGQREHVSRLLPRDFLLLYITTVRSSEVSPSPFPF